MSAAALPDEKLMGNWNSRPTATRLREISVPGTGQEFHAYEPDVDREGFEGAFGDLIGKGTLVDGHR